MRGTMAPSFAELLRVSTPWQGPSLSSSTSPSSLPSGQLRQFASLPFLVLLLIRFRTLSEMLHQQMLGSLFTRSRLTSLRPFRLHQGNAASVIRSPQAHLRDYESNRPKLVSFASTCVIVLSYASVVQKEGEPEKAVLFSSKRPSPRTSCIIPSSFHFSDHP